MAATFVLLLLARIAEIACPRIEHRLLELGSDIFAGPCRPAGAKPLRCPYCQFDDSKVIDTTHDSHGGIRRRRECLHCGQRFSSYERPILATPLIVKQDGTREEFDRQKLERGIRIACAKRPVSAADIERLVGQVEADLQRQGKAEISSRVVGDLVIKGLKEMDQIAYIRYAIVYLRLDDLHALRSEIDRLLIEP
jgi:transcriptional repressor NrdR